MCETRKNPILGCHKIILVILTKENSRKLSREKTTNRNFHSSKVALGKHCGSQMALVKHRESKTSHRNCRRSKIVLRNYYGSKTAHRKHCGSKRTLGNHHGSKTIFTNRRRGERESRNHRENEMALEQHLGSKLAHKSRCGRKTITEIIAAIKRPLKIVAGLKEFPGLKRARK